jgi:hypothetical protein
MHRSIPAPGTGGRLAWVDRSLWGSPWAVALGYLRLMTSPKVLTQPMNMGVALGHLHLGLEQPSVLILQPSPRHLSILPGFCEASTQ